MANDNKQKLKHIIVSYENFEKLRKFGYANDSMNDVITKILEKKESESDELPTL
jgi:predicted CopG family antitoxin